MRSPEAVLECSEYQDARPHWAEAGEIDAARVSAEASATPAAAAVVFVICLNLSVLR
jgi:hypothetical protein